ncbi:hypothetical protein GD429_33680 [Burkholderia sp. BE17]|nr:hypothetical protein [Burkholderia sp. BE17]
MSFGARRRARIGKAGAVTHQASDERYLIGVRPVLINVFVDDLVEFLVADPRSPQPSAARAAESPV